MRIGGVGRDAKAVEGVNSFQTIKALGHKNDIRMQSRDHFQTRVDSAADLGFFLRVLRVVAVVSVSDETILQAQRVDRFGQTRRQRNDAVDRLGNANRAAGFVSDFTKSWRCRRDRSSALRTRHRRAKQQACDKGEGGTSKARTGEFFHESPFTTEFVFSNKKAPRDTLGLLQRAFSRRARPLRHGRVAWLTTFQPITVAGPRPPPPPL